MIQWTKQKQLSLQIRIWISSIPKRRFEHNNDLLKFAEAFFSPVLWEWNDGESSATVSSIKSSADKNTMQTGAYFFPYYLFFFANVYLQLSHFQLYFPYFRPINFKFLEYLWYFRYWFLNVLSFFLDISFQGCYVPKSSALQFF